MMARLFIGGAFREADKVEPVIEAATGEPLGDGSAATESEIDDAVAAARSALDGWRSTPAAERSEALKRFADALQGRAAETTVAIRRGRRRCRGPGGGADGRRPAGHDDRHRSARQLATARTSAQLYRHRKSEGAKLVAGGSVPAGQPGGWFVAPTVFANVDNRARISQEEIFGPVLTVIPYEDDSDAVDIANDTEFVLGGSVWSTDVERATETARRVRTGIIGVNDYQMDIAAPFGGVKASGIGREVGPEGLAAYQTLKSIYRVGPSN
jgi:acyl-CoA reductase-like NAD-dependent aldehyde dehydrogenase